MGPEPPNALHKNQTPKPTKQLRKSGPQGVVPQGVRAGGPRPVRGVPGGLLQDRRPGRGPPGQGAHTKGLTGSRSTGFLDCIFPEASKDVRRPLSELTGPGKGNCKRGTHKRSLLHHFQAHTEGCRREAAEAAVHRRAGPGGAEAGPGEGADEGRLLGGAAKPGCNSGEIMLTFR